VCHHPVTVQRYVSVIGPGSDASAADTDLAREVGRLVAQRGAVLVNGGRLGVMAAAAEGASASGGVSVGILPGVDRSEASEHLVLALPTGLGEARNVLVVTSADAVIAVGGSWGTLSEIALAMRMGKPVVSLRGWRLFDDSGDEIPVERAGTPAEAVERAFALMPA
jgi:uncharacterized protein (TIGR00725 family)